MRPSRLRAPRPATKPGRDWSTQAVPQWLPPFFYQADSTEGAIMTTGSTVAPIKPLQSRQGFTLIELLIVVVIIGILAAIAIPKFANTKEKGVVASMKSDLRNLASAQESYWVENRTYYGGVIPAAGFLYNTSPGVTITIV